MAATALLRDKINGSVARQRMKAPSQGRYQIQPMAIIVSDRLMDKVAFSVMTPRLTMSRTIGTQSTVKRTIWGNHKSCNIYLLHQKSSGYQRRTGLFTPRLEFSFIFNIKPIKISMEEFMPNNTELY